MAAVVLALAGCMTADEEVSIPPLSAAGERANPGLGPGTHPLSSGPGYKGSPSWSPQGDRIAFTVDGYVAEKPLDAGAVRRWTKEDFLAEDAEWTSEGSLAIFGSSSTTRTDEASGALYRTRSQGGSPEMEEVATEVLAMSPGSEGEGLIAALETEPHESGLALVRSNGTMDRLDTRPIEGRATGISLSPDGRRVVVAVGGSLTWRT